jgi:RNA-binding protein Nova
MSEPKSGKTVSIKMLLSNNLAGSLIGLGGKSIKDLIEVSGAKVHVSASAEPYPGTSDRVIAISGDLESVSLAQNLIWEMIGLITSAENPREVQWNPKDMVNFLGQNDGVEVTGKVTIPAAAGGLILGKGGSNIQSMAEESGANIGMSSKEEAIFTQERVLTITGTLGSCMKATSLIMQKLDEPAEFTPYVNKGTTYSTAHMQSNPFVMPFGGYGVFGAGIPYPTMGAPASGRREGRQGGHRGNGGGGQGGGGGYYPGSSELDNAAAATPVETTITFTVPDEMVGNILGKMVCQMLAHQLAHLFSSLSFFYLSVTFRVPR